MDRSEDPRLNVASQLQERVVLPLKAEFVGKDEIIDLMAVCLVGGEHLFLLGPPGTAKSALVQALGRRLQGRVFDYLLTRFTEPNELFGPFDIRRLREGDLVTNTEGMLPEASFVFLDELLNANSAILNSLLLVLNERVFRRGRETRQLPLLMAVGASNHLPQDDSLKALFDRFLVRVPCDNVSQEQLASVLQAGWVRESMNDEAPSGVTVDDIAQLQTAVADVDVSGIRPVYLELIHRLRHAGIPVSDRRAVKFQRLIAASALICGRAKAVASDLWVLRSTWETDEQRDVIAELVQQAIDRSGDDETRIHPRSRLHAPPDAESLARDLDRIRTRAEDSSATDAERRYLRDQLGVLAGRIDWVTDAGLKTQLQDRARGLWERLESAP
ncbi:MAG TPA: AAA family ATPase [Caulifigura sp.]|nr:AAA family ATPase [Caulifigura sp.]